MAHRHFSKSITPVFPRIGSWFNNLGGSQVPASLCFRFVGSCFMLCPGPEASLSAKQVLTSSELARRQQGPPQSLMAAPSVYLFSAMRAGAHSPLTPDSATNALRLLGWKNIAQPRRQHRAKRFPDEPFTRRIQSFFFSLSLLILFPRVLWHAGSLNDWHFPHSIFPPVSSQQRPYLCSVGDVVPLTHHGTRLPLPSIAVAACSPPRPP